MLYILHTQRPLTQQPSATKLIRAPYLAVCCLSQKHRSAQVWKVVDNNCSKFQEYKTIVSDYASKWVSYD